MTEKESKYAFRTKNVCSYMLLKCMKYLILYNTFKLGRKKIKIISLKILFFMTFLKTTYGSK